MRIWTAAPVICTMILVLTGSMSAEDEENVDLRVGDIAPAFSAIDDQGQPWNSADLVGKKHVVVYFFPADFTSGCRAQAQKFRDNMNALNESGIMVVGISGDAVMTHALFKKAENINFTLLADEDGTIARQFGVPLGKGGVVRTKDFEGEILELKREVTAARWTFIIGLDGKIAYKNTKVIPAKDSQQVAEFIEQLQQK